MKLLFDQNLSPKLVYQLKEIYPNSVHVQQVNLHSEIDSKIWDFAKKNNFIIVSKDIDFYERVLIQGFPPKVIWLSLGNCSTNDIMNILRLNYNRVIEFEKNRKTGILIL